MTPEETPVTEEVVTPSEAVDTPTTPEQLSAPQELTYGQKAVGITFNPSGNSEVDACKEAFGMMIDRMNTLRNETQSFEAKGMYSMAITRAQEAQMRAVKAITWKYE